jgi:hypothetical protein
MKQITITMEDDGRIIVESPEMDEPYMCESVDECMDYVENMLGGEGMDEEQMWNEEAAARAPQPGMMA